jgi:cobalt-zinc-cadmium efflux system membrane fusion protein
MAIALTLILAATLLSGCGKSENTSAPRESSSTSNAPQSEAAVELSPSQLNAIKIEPVGTYLFPVEKEAVGSVSFDEDPATVQAESTLISAAATRLGATATFELTGKELARVRSLGETNGIAQKELEQATSDQQNAEAALKTAGAALKAARDAVRALGETDAEIDEMIAAGKIESTPATTRWVLANVLESDSPLFRAGQTVQVKVTAFSDRVFDGKISRIYATVDPNTHRVAIRCEVEDSKAELRPGMLADVVIRVQDPADATAIPVDGVVRESDGTMTAWVTTDRHRFVQKVVKTRLCKDGQVEILEGLQRGELAVTEGAIFLSNLLNAPPSD